ncbi:MAG: hypothetical protein ACE5KL_02490 [Alphaproteobacteria bacterium]
MIKKLALALFASSFLATGAQAQSKLPPDPSSTCSVSESEFASWFASGTVTKDGWVRPADSVGFPQQNTKCDFYKWSAQMFLWLTSPEPAGSGRYVFDTDLFYDVSPENAVGHREFIPSSAGNPFALRLQKPEEIEETGQAGGGAALISQEGSLVYYGIHTNDVYAYFLTGQKGGQIQASDFPTTRFDLDAVERFAGRPFSDGIALTMELKTSWVDAATVDASKYVTITATVPSYTRTNNKTWSLAGTETKNLALVGFHVVGTVQGHPEMVWATFEHLSNTPDNDYYYQAADGTTRVVKYDSSGEWLFMASNGSRTGANAERAKVNGAGDIVAYTKQDPNQTIGPSNTYRVNPWGDSGGQVSSAENNTEIISLNTDVLGYLAPGDVRANYIQIGALWTQHGQIPPNPNAKQIGSLDLANSTMETYHQNLNCFTCHQGTSFGKDQLSHIYWNLQPLTPK